MHLTSHMQKQVILWRGSYFPVRRLANYNGQSGQTSLVTLNQLITFTNMDLALSREGNRNGQRKRVIPLFYFHWPSLEMNIILDSQSLKGFFILISVGFIPAFKSIASLKFIKNTDFVARSLRVFSEAKLSVDIYVVLSYLLFIFPSLFIRFDLSLIARN